MIEQLKALPYVRRSSLNYAFELENDAISGSSAYYPNDKKWDDWSGNSGNNWNMKAIDAPGAWVYRDQMKPVNVGVIEEIFDFYHEDLTFQEMPFGNVSAWDLTSIMVLDGGHRNKAMGLMWQELLVRILIMKKVFAELHRMQNYMVLLIKRARPDNSFISLRKQH